MVKEKLSYNFALFFISGGYLKTVVVKQRGLQIMTIKAKLVIRRAEQKN